MHNKINRSIHIIKKRELIHINTYIKFNPELKTPPNHCHKKQAIIPSVITYITQGLSCILNLTKKMHPPIFLTKIQHQ